MTTTEIIKHNSIKLSMLALLALGLYAPVLWGLAKDWWEDPNYSHGMLIPFISGFFIWERRRRLSGLTLRPNNLGLVVAVAAILMLVAGNLGAELFLQRISFVLLLIGIILYLGGLVHFRRMLFPLLLLFTMIPLPAIILYQVTFPLQLLSSKMATHSIRLLHIPVLREGNTIHMANISMEVVEACSGIRSLFTLLTIGLVLAYVTQSRLLSRALVVASAVPIAIIANSARLTGTALLAQYFGVHLAEGFLHTFSGWLIVLLACVLLLIEVGILGRIERWFVPRAAAEAPPLEEKKELEIR